MKQPFVATLLEEQPPKTTILSVPGEIKISNILIQDIIRIQNNLGLNRNTEAAR